MHIEHGHGVRRYQLETATLWLASPSLVRGAGMPRSLHTGEYRFMHVSMTNSMLLASSFKLA